MTDSQPVEKKRPRCLLAFMLLAAASLGCATRSDQPNAGLRSSDEKQSKMTTNNYILIIEHNCPEGCVSCDNVALTCTSKRTGTTVKLKGSTWHIRGADGATPSRFIGYTFRKGNQTYRVLEDGRFEIVDKDSRVLVKEKWQLDEGQSK